MASLKDLRIRINSVQSTKKITSAMKMVAASKLRRAQEAAERARPYAKRMERVMENLLAGAGDQDIGNPLLIGNGHFGCHLVVVMTANRGLCGGFNTNIIRRARLLINDLLAQNKTVKIFTIGSKGLDSLRREYSDAMVGHFDEFAKSGVSYEVAQGIVTNLVDMFDAGSFDVCTLVYANFVSAMTQEVTQQQIIPLPVSGSERSSLGASYEYEPSDKEILDDLLPRNLAVQLFGALLENGASEQGARMTAMDSATRNAGDMIDKLTLTYNRTRQAQITTELIEIISGAEAL
ncbi:MAG: F0F1 ATP synthase subunit gamma [Rhodospirillaceae bacterium]|nr:F0F1 ATP synthase subunit gamma [Rhodospirillaceae bacterium]